MKVFNVNNPEVLQFFETIQAGIVVLDNKQQVVLANQEAGRIFGKTPAELVGGADCCKLFRQEKKPCACCLIADDPKPWPKQKSVTLKNQSGIDQFLKVQFAPLGDHVVLTIQDASREGKLLRGTDLTRREQLAKNVLLERQGADKEKHYFEQLLDHLPEALVMVDSEFTLQKQNLALADILPQHSARKCFELVGRKSPCSKCPAKRGFVFNESRKKSHVVGGRYITEIITASPFGEGGVLSFRDSTRQVELIAAIRDTQEMLGRQNKILSGLVELGMYMQQGIEPKQVVGFFLDLFLPVLQTNAAAVLINDIRVGNLWLAEHWGMDDVLLNRLAKAYLDRDIQNFRSDVLPPEFFPWPKTTQVVLTGADGRRVGLIVLRGEYNTDSEMIHLFAEQMGAYIHNQLLMRQLEEKAYTDPLTGLFNRAYIDKALSEEHEKFKKYDIQYAVVIGDVNRLKEVNDAYGHETGDRLLQLVGTILMNEARATDIVARTGGDEFVILLTNSTNKSAQLFTKRLQEVAFRGITLDVGEDEKFPVSISLGASGTDAVPPEKLLHEADKLMYEAKKEYYANHPFYRSRPLWANV